MRPGLAGRLSRALVGCHPRRWRERYGEEMLDVLDQHHSDPRTVASLPASVLSTHADPAYRADRLSLSRLRRAALISAAVAAPLALVLGPLGYRMWQDTYWHPAADEPLENCGVLAAHGHHGHRFRGSHRRRGHGVGCHRPEPGRGACRSSRAASPIALSPEGRTVATIAYNGQAALWNVADPRRPVKMTTLSDGDGSKLWALAFSPDSQILATAHYDRDLPVGHGQPGPAPPARHAGRPGDVPGRRRPHTDQPAGPRVLPRREHPGQRHRHRSGHPVERDRPGARLPHGYPRRRGRLHPGVRLFPPREPAGRRDLPRHRAGPRPGRPDPTRPAPPAPPRSAAC